MFKGKSVSKSIKVFHCFPSIGVKIIIFITSGMDPVLGPNDEGKGIGVEEL
jgi:hypothetical protein